MVAVLGQTFYWIDGMSALFITSALLLTELLTTEEGTSKIMTFPHSMPDLLGFLLLKFNAMDAQRRIQLEPAYEALENAAIPLAQLRGYDTAVYVGVLSRCVRNEANVRRNGTFLNENWVPWVNSNW